MDSSWIFRDSLSEFIIDYTIVLRPRHARTDHVMSCEDEQTHRACVRAHAYRQALAMPRDTLTNRTTPPWLDAHEDSGTANLKQLTPLLAAATPISGMR